MLSNKKQFQTYCHDLISSAQEMTREPQTSTTLGFSSFHEFGDLFIGTCKFRPCSSNQTSDLMKFKPPSKWVKVFKKFQFQGPLEVGEGLIYFGQQWKNLRHGFGKLLMQHSSELFEGFFFTGKMHGPGRLVFANGSAVIGSWFQDKLCEGTFYDKKGFEFLRITQPSVEMEAVREEKQYQGGIVAGLRHGHGRYQWKDGTFYQGQFHKGLIEGFGTMQYADGRRYVGYWKNNQMDGFGQFEWPNGTKYLGMYKADKRHGYGLLFMEGKAIFKEFAEGQIVK